MPGVQQLFAGDLLDPNGTTRIMSVARPTVVVHLAARGVGMSGDDRDRPGAADVAMTESVLDAIERADGVRHVIFASSAAVYAALDSGPLPESADIGPTSDYGISKAASELRVRAFANDTRTATVLRFANVVGAGERRSSVVSSVCRQIAEAKRGSGAAVVRHGRVAKYLIRDYWVDIGQLSDYEMAKETYQIEEARRRGPTPSVKTTI